MSFYLKRGCGKITHILFFMIMSNHLQSKLQLLLLNRIFLVDKYSMTNYSLICIFLFHIVKKIAKMDIFYLDDRK